MGGVCEKPIGDPEGSSGALLDATTYSTYDDTEILIFQSPQHVFHHSTRLDYATTSTSRMACATLYATVPAERTRTGKRSNRRGTCIHPS